MYGVLATPIVVDHRCPGYSVKDGTPVGVEHWAGNWNLFGAFFKRFENRMRLRMICFGVIPNHPVSTENLTFSPIWYRGVDAGVGRASLAARMGRVDGALEWAQILQFVRHRVSSDRG